MSSPSTSEQLRLLSSWLPAYPHLYTDVHRSINSIGLFDSVGSILYNFDSKGTKYNDPMILAMCAERLGDDGFYAY